jgi:hypothetical protein
MTMPCRITDEKVYNAQSDEFVPRKGLQDISLHDLMAEDNYVWVARNVGYGYLLELENNQSTEPYLREVGLNPNAMECLATFCRRYLSFYEKIERN